MTDPRWLGLYIGVQMAGMFVVGYLLGREAEALRKGERLGSDSARTCPKCLHGWHGRRVCRDANCCSCRLTRVLPTNGG